ncbi:MAG: hypothetical protein LBH58_11350, partial [Tannerellaceae bacterium]|nr:hypothetical protein [Tannerellaceae bacterium]
EEKKKRWNKVMSMDKSMARRWNDSSECRGCFHLEKDSWCNYNDLPCTVNPILTFRMGMTGMACYGLGRVEREPELFDNESKFKL